MSRSRVGTQTRRIQIAPGFNLKTAVGSRKSAQALGAPGKLKKLLITNKVTTNFFNLPCTPTAYASFSRPTAVFRLKTLFGFLGIAEINFLTLEGSTTDESAFQKSLQTAQAFIAQLEPLP